MRVQSEIQLTIHGRTIGGPRPLICVPLMAASREALLEQAGAVDRLQPDLIEWRADAFEGLSDLAYVHQTLKALRAGRPAQPLLFTCRAPAEGGVQTIAADQRRKLYHMVIRTGLADLIDIELASGPTTIRDLRAETTAAGVHLILSFHDFDRTPGREILWGKLQEAQQAGADIAKIAVMPRSCRDVVTLLDAACEARHQFLKIPLIAIAMGEAGVVTRLAGGQFGSDIVFASGAVATAPGQLAIQDLRKVWSVLTGPKDRQPQGVPGAPPLGEA